jgi:Zn-dependent protease
MQTEMLVVLPILLFSIVFHEYSHGVIAEKCGDDTARVLGRISLNPLKHIDLIGTIILPLVLLLSCSRFLFAWAKPVPINPRKFKDYKLDMMKVAAAGPLSNLILVFFTLLFLFVFRLVSFQDPMLFAICKYAVYINIMLMIFNLLPIMPLDGARILHEIAPQNIRQIMDKVEPFGFFILLILINIPLFRKFFIFVIYFISENLLRIVL